MSHFLSSPGASSPEPRWPTADVAGVVLSSNERHVLDIVRRNSLATRASVTHATELTAQSISRIVDGLVERGFLTLGDRIPNGRGQPSARLTLNRQAAYSVGISIMTDAVSGAVMDLSGQAVAADRSRLISLERADIFAATRSLYDRLLRKALIEGRSVVGVGAAVTGYFVGKGRQLNPPDPLGELALVDIDTMLAESLQRPVWVDNDGNVAAMGEVLTGVGQRFRTFAYLYFAMGLGGGVIINGQVFPGAFGNAGEFAGVMPPEWHEERPTMELLRIMMERRGRRHADIYEMIHGFDLDAPGVEDWIECSLPKLNSIISAIGAVLDPDAIVLGGRIPKTLARRLAERMEFYSVPRRGAPRPFPRIIASEVEGDAAAIGAAAIPLKARFFF